MKWSATTRGVLATLAYSAQFQFPLSAAEIRERLPLILLSPQQPKPTPAEVTKSLRLLKRVGLVGNAEGWWYLQDQGYTVAIRRVRQGVTRKKLAEAKVFGHWLSKQSWVEGVWVTGAVAARNAPPNDDIDFLIVTSPKRLWLVRLQCSIFALWHGRRRSWAGNEPNSWCFNAWLTPTTLNWFLTSFSLYTAYELLQAMPLWSTDELWHQFHTLYGARLRQELPSARLQSPPIFKSRPRPGWLEPVWDWLNQAAYVLQKLYMRRHITTEVVSAEVALFHPRPTSSLIQAGWLRQLHLLAAAESRVQSNP